MHCLVLGFAPAEFVRVESGGTYFVEAGFLSGATDSGGRIPIELQYNTASMYIYSYVQNCFFTLIALNAIFDRYE